LAETSDNPQIDGHRSPASSIAAEGTLSRMTTDAVRPTFAARSDTGLVRSSNEDRFIAEPPIFAVADGMGGPNAGEVAATIAIATLRRVTAGGSATSQADLTRLLEESHREIRARAGAEPDLAGMGTTCTVALVDGASAHIAHVGDSRAYLLRAGRLDQLTDDHSLVASMVREGLIDEEDARLHRRRNIITRALGADQTLNVDVLTVGLLPADRLLLCTDGLTAYVADAAIADVLTSGADPQRAVDRLIDLANDAGGNDNVTVVVIDPPVPGEPS
jgi:protein phosphatase